MALVQPDFSEVKDEVVPGTYNVIIKKAEEKEFQSGTSYLNWELETVGESDPKNNGRRIFYKTPLTGPGAFTLQRLYKAAMGQALTGNFDTEHLMGKKVQVEVIEGVDRRTGEKTGYNEIKTVKSVAV